MGGLILVKDFMTTEVISVKAETPVSEVVKILFEHGFNGVPVVNDTNDLVGLITEYDFIAGGSPVYFSPIGRILKELEKVKKDESKVKEAMRQMLSAPVKDFMNADPVTLFETNTLMEAARLFMLHHRINPIPIINEYGKLTGIISRHDLVKLHTDPAFWQNFLKKSE